MAFRGFRRPGPVVPRSGLLGSVDKMILQQVAQIVPGVPGHGLQILRRDHPGQGNGHVQIHL